MAEEDLVIPFGAKSLPAVLTRPAGTKQIHKGILLTHGAGGDHHHPQLELTARHLSEQGFLCLRFTCKSLNIGYRVKAFGCALDYFLSTNKHIKRVTIGGRSMGARVACWLSSRSFTQSPCSEESLRKISGVICLAYPLNAKGRSVTSDHLDPLVKLKVPVIFVAGTHDPLCQRSDFERVIQEMSAKVAVIWRQDCGHELENKDEPFDSVLQDLIDWCTKQ